MITRMRNNQITACHYYACDIVTNTKCMSVLIVFIVLLRHTTLNQTL